MFRPKLDTSFANQMHELCITNNVQLAKEFYDRNKTKNILTFDGKYDFTIACIEGRLEMAMFLYEIFEINREDIINNNNFIFCNACKNGFLSVVKWLFDLCNFTNEELKSQNNFALKWACINGHENTVKWLLSVCTYTNYEINFALNLLRMHNYFELEKWIRDFKK